MGSSGKAVAVNCSTYQIARTRPSRRFQTSSPEHWGSRFGDFWDTAGQFEAPLHGLPGLEEAAETSHELQQQLQGESCSKEDLGSVFRDGAASCKLPNRRGCVQQHPRYIQDEKSNFCMRPNFICRPFQTCGDSNESSGNTEPVRASVSQPMPGFESSVLDLRNFSYSSSGALL